jgi:hypothetical protein
MIWEEVMACTKACSKKTHGRFGERQVSQPGGLQDIHPLVVANKTVKFRWGYIMEYFSWTEKFMVYLMIIWKWWKTLYLLMHLFISIFPYFKKNLREPTKINTISNKIKACKDVKKRKWEGKNNIKIVKWHQEWVVHKIA